MKNFILIALVLIFSGSVLAQNPFLRDGSDIHLKISTDKVGIGTGALTDKVTIGSVAEETPLGLIGYPNHYNSYITLYNSTGVSIWKLYANNDWFTIGSTIDTANALLVGKILKGWMKVNGTGSFTKLIGTTISGTTGAITNFKATTDTVTTFKATTGTITTLGSTTATVTHLEATDTAGIVLTNKNGTKYRIHISNSGAVLVTSVP